MIEQSVTIQKTPLGGRFSFGQRLLVGAGVFFFLAAWLLPNHYPPWVSFHNEAMAFAALILFMTLFVGHRPLLKLDGIGLAILLLVPLVWVQFLVGQIVYFGDALISCLYILGFVGAWWIGRSCADSSQLRQYSLKVFAILLVSAGAVSVWIAVQQWLRIGSVIGFNSLLELEPNARPFANLGQPNHLATMLLMVSAMASLLFIQGVFRLWQYAGFLLLFVLGLVLADSRAAWVSVFVFSTLYIWRGRKLFGGRGWAMLAVWIVSLVAMSAAVKVVNEVLLLADGGRVISFTQDSNRLTMWKQFLAAIQQSPWWGYGWRQTVVAQKIGALYHAGNLPTDYAHSVVLDVLVWVGIPAGTLILLAVAGWLLCAASRIVDRSQFFVASAIIPFVVHSLVEFPFAYAYFLFPVAWLAGFLHRSQQTDRSATVGVMRRMPGIASAIALAGFSLIGVEVVREYLLAEEDFRVMRFELRAVGRVPDGYAAPELPLLTQLNEMLTVARWEPLRGMPQERIERLRVANASFSWATLQVKLIVALAINGQMESASQELKSLRAIYGEPSYLQAISRIKSQSGQYPELLSLPF